MKKFFEVVEKIFVLLLKLLNVLIIGCPFAAYPRVWNSLQVDGIPFWREILLIFLMGALIFNAVFSMKRLIDMRNGKHKGDEFDVQLVVDDKKNLKYVKVYKNGKIFEVKDVNEIPVNDNGEANAKEN